MDAYLAIIDRSGLRALLPESANGALLAAELQSRLPAAACYWTVLDSGPAAVVTELLEEDEPRLAMRFLQSHVRDAGLHGTQALPLRDVA